MLIIQFHPYMLGMVGFVDAACAPKNPSYKPRLFNIMATWYLIHIYYYSIQPWCLNTQTRNKSIAEFPHHPPHPRPSTISLLSSLPKSWNPIFYPTRQQFSGWLLLSVHITRTYPGRLLTLVCLYWLPLPLTSHYLSISCLPLQPPPTHHNTLTHLFHMQDVYEVCGDEWKWMKTLMNDAWSFFYV